MSNDIGPGDVVEVIRSAQQNPNRWPVGSRHIVHGLGWPKPELVNSCRVCGQRALVVLATDPSGPWCICGLRKIGGSQADTVQRFAERLVKTKVNA